MNLFKGLLIHVGDTGYERDNPDGAAHDRDEETVAPEGRDIQAKVFKDVVNVVHEALEHADEYAVVLNRVTVKELARQHLWQRTLIFGVYVLLTNEGLEVVDRSLPLELKVLIISQQYDGRISGHMKLQTDQLVLFLRAVNLCDRQFIVCHFFGQLAPWLLEHLTVGAGRRVKVDQPTVFVV